MRRSGFDFDVITGPSAPRPAPKPEPKAEVTEKRPPGEPGK